MYTANIYQKKSNWTEKASERAKPGRKLSVRMGCTGAIKVTQWARRAQAKILTAVANQGAGDLTTEQSKRNGSSDSRKLRTQLSSFSLEKIVGPNASKGALNRATRKRKDASLASSGCVYWLVIIDRRILK